MPSANSVHRCSENVCISTEHFETFHVWGKATKVLSGRNTFPTWLFQHNCDPGHSSVTQPQWAPANWAPLWDAEETKRMPRSVCWFQRLVSWYIKYHMFIWRVYVHMNTHLLSTSPVLGSAGSFVLFNHKHNTTSVTKDLTLIGT